APEGGRGRGGRLPARRQGPGHLRLRDPGGGRGGERRAAQGAGGARAQGDRADRVPGLPAVGAGPAEDALGQDHAPDPAQDRRERARPAGRHQHPGRPVGGRLAGQEPARRVIAGGGGGQALARHYSDTRAAGPDPPGAHRRTPGIAKPPPPPTPPPPPARVPCRPPPTTPTHGRLAPTLPAPTDERLASRPPPHPPGPPCPPSSSQTTIRCSARPCAAPWSA